MAEPSPKPILIDVQPGRVLYETSSLLTLLSTTLFAGERASSDGRDLGDRKG